MEQYIVFVKTDPDGYITAVNSSAFLPDTTGWTEIDRGFGDRYHHAQGNYFPQPIITDCGAYRYKLVESRISECTEEEIRMQEESRKPVPAPSTEERIAELEEQNAMLTECLLEISEIIYS